MHRVNSMVLVKVLSKVEYNVRLRTGIWDEKVVLGLLGKNWRSALLSSGSWSLKPLS